MKRTNSLKNNRWTLILTAIFCLFIGWIILFKMTFSISSLDRVRSINLIPFYYDEETPFHFTEVMLNVIAFIPFGIYLKLLKFDFKKAVLMGFLYSLTLELLQFILRVGITDITDLITNTSGVVIGAAMYGLLSKIFKRADKLDKALKILATIGTVMMLTFTLIIIVVNI